MKYYSVNQYLKDRFGEKIYKISLNGGFTCPNRDGTLGDRGCIFCSASGSGDFSESASLSITEQIERGKKRLEKKIKNGKYIAYFQSFTNTYAPVARLRKIFMEAIRHPDIVVLSIATRPDCLPEEVLLLLEDLNKIKPVWVELGLQSIHEKTAAYIRRGYALPVFEKAVRELKKRNLETIVHVILGLPGESEKDILETVSYVGDQAKQGNVQGIKLQLLHVLKGTDLAIEYEKGLVPVMSMEEYISLVVKCLSVLPENLVIHRLTGDGDKRILIAPEWSGNKKLVMDRMQKAIINVI